VWRLRHELQFHHDEPDCHDPAAAVDSDAAFPWHVLARRRSRVGFVVLASITDGLDGYLARSAARLPQWACC